MLAIAMAKAVSRLCNLFRSIDDVLTLIVGFHCSSGIVLSEPSPVLLAQTPTKATVKAIVACQTIPIIIVTGQAETADEETGAETPPLFYSPEGQVEDTPESQPIATPEDTSPVHSIHIELGPDLEAALRVYREAPAPSSLSIPSIPLPEGQLGKSKFYIATDSDSENQGEEYKDHNPHLQSVDFDPSPYVPLVSPWRRGRVVKITWDYWRNPTYEYTDGANFKPESDEFTRPRASYAEDPDDNFDASSCSCIPTPAPAYEDSPAYEDDTDASNDDAWLGEIVRSQSAVEGGPHESATRAALDQYYRDLRDEQRDRGVLVAERTVPWSSLVRELN